MYCLEIEFASSVNMIGLASPISAPVNYLAGNTRQLWSCDVLTFNNSKHQPLSSFITISQSQVIMLKIIIH